MKDIPLLISIIQISVLVLGFLGVGFIPQYFYNKKLNKLKGEISKLNISVEQNHPIKMERYRDFVENFFEYGKLKNNALKDKKLMESFKSISNAVFLFGSDDSMNAFLKLREGLPTNPTEGQKMEYLVIGAKFMVELRKDLNGGSSEITAEHYLRMLLNDWDERKEELIKYL